MELEDMENTEMPEDAMKEVLGMGFSFADLEARNADLMPKIRFTTDPEEAEAAKNADRSDPLRLPDTVIYVGPKDADGESEAGDTGDASERPIPRLTRDSDDYDFSQPLSKDTYAMIMKLAELAKDNEPEPSGDKDVYAGPSVRELDYKIEEATKTLTRAEANLEETIARGGNILSAQSLVDNARDVLSQLLSMHREAIKHQEAM